MIQDDTSMGGEVGVHLCTYFVLRFVVFKDWVPKNKEMHTWKGFLVKYDLYNCIYICVYIYIYIYACLQIRMANKTHTMYKHVNMDPKKTS